MYTVKEIYLYIYKSKKRFGTTVLLSVNTSIRFQFSQSLCVRKLVLSCLQPQMNTVPEFQTVIITEKPGPQPIAASVRVAGTDGCPDFGVSIGYQSNVSVQISVETVRLPD